MATELEELKSEICQLLFKFPATHTKGLGFCLRQSCPQPPFFVALGFGKRQIHRNFKVVA